MARVSFTSTDKWYEEKRMENLCIEIMRGIYFFFFPAAAGFSAGLAAGAGAAAGAAAGLAAGFASFFPIHSTFFCEFRIWF